MIDMQPDLNPFAPGSGRPPPVLVGRQTEIDAFDLTIARSRARQLSRGIILHGLRGVGKTVLLNRFREQAERSDWFVVEIEGQAGPAGQAAVRQKLARAFLLAASKAHRSKKWGQSVRRALGTVKSFSISLGVAKVEIGVDATQGRADSGDIAIDLEELVADLAPALREESSAIGIFIDEMQDLDPELLSALLTVQHRAGQKDWPFYVVGAGLPVLPSVLSGIKSYAERLFDYRRVGPLSPVPAMAAIADPVRIRGADFEPKALQDLLDAAEGYPYFLQTYGRAAWDAARTTTISVEDAEAAITVGHEELDMGFYPARWERVTPAERRYMQAMAESGTDSISTRDIVSRLGSTLSRQSNVRQSLISKGIAYAPERGYLAFTVPGMSAFIRRQYAD